ncbi:hypothetical protein [Gluconobacter japonicus]|uniref:hypothetical protein n=1 Tax=Gluconobacter japonicus TaxID=376620 RepID=UPI000783BF01|nr:hypothetical protein [Gluconobacter japonicus]KXV20665.1 hypothetical protein AD935_11345 [Gluconobacter japonicus]MBS1050449.1 hypothetical protein [Gluconobacter japonicus]
MRLRNRFAVLGLSAVLLGSTVACTTTGSTTTFNTAALNKDATAIAYAVQVIETMPGVVDHLSAEDKAKFDNLVSQIKSVTASIEASSDGSITVNTGKDWAKSLGTDLNTLLTIAAPIVSVYYPSASTYLSTVQAMIPLVEALAGVTAAPYAAPVDSPALLRARIYQGV